MIRFNDNAHVQQTVRCKISDAQIRKYARDPRVKQLKDERYSLYFCFGKIREKGTWRYIEYKNSKQKSYRLGRYPNLSAQHVFTVLQHLVVELTTGERSSCNEFKTVDELLVWYMDREIRAKLLSKSRINTVKCLTEGHLLPNLHGLSIRDLRHKDIEKNLIKPLREAGYSISYIRIIFQTLKTAFNNAAKLNLLTHNPTLSMKFTDFISTPIDVKGCKVRPSDTVDILNNMDNAEPFARALCLMMLAHGTRVGETRLAKWRHICFKTKRWTIPQHHTKTRKEIVYPLSDDMVEFLSAFKQWQIDNHYKGNNVFPLNKRDKAPIHKVRASELVRSVSKQQWTAHDLRKLARTIWADLGIDYIVAETLLNHAKSKLDQAYIHSHLELQKAEAIKTYHFWLKKCWRGCFCPLFQ